MDKEKLITIVIGLLVGIGLASAYFLSPNFFPPKSKPEIKKVTTGTPPPPKRTTDEKVPSIAIDQPENNSSTTQSTIEVSGRTIANSQLVFYANADEKIGSSDGEGKFKTSLKLEEGTNQISVSTIDPQGEIITAKSNVTLEIK